MGNEGKRVDVPSRPIAGGGAAGDRIRFHDWSDSSLGRPENWPPALRTAVNLMLSSPESMFLAWGPDLLFFHNDAYAPILGPRLPHAMGVPLPRLWSDVWSQVEPMVGKALRGEPSRYEDLPLTMARYGEEEQTWWTFSYSALRDESGAIVGMFCITNETTGRVRSQAELKASEAYWRSLFERFHEGFMLGEVVRDADGVARDCRYLETNAAWGTLTGLERSTIVGRTVREAMPDVEPEWIGDFVRVAESGEPMNVTRYAGAVGKWYEAHIFSAGPDRFAMIFSDVTERRRSEEARALLMREVDHRAKNALAVVQALVRMSRADSVEAFQEAVQGRVQAMARAHSVLASNRWSGGDLLTLVREELRPFEDRCSIEGQPLSLRADDVQPIALALHELATNAAKHGALSVDGGRVSVRWKVERPSGWLHLAWKEQGGPAVVAPRQAGFGSRLLEQSLVAQTSGRLDLDWRPGGLVCELSIPIAEDAAMTAKPAAYGGDGRPDPGATSGLTVLVVEDQVLIAMELAAMVESAGHVVLGPVAELADAMAAAAAESFDVALLDADLRGRSAKVVASILAERGIPYVWCTGFEEFAEDSHASGIVRKPVSEWELRRALGGLAAPSRHRKGQRDS